VVLSLEDDFAPHLVERLLNYFEIPVVGPVETALVGG
jgi:hypothetical protein